MTKNEEFTEKFTEIYTENITREGADALFQYLQTKTDFFTSPASAYYHAAYEGGLVEHSVNVYECLVDYLSRVRVQKMYGMSGYSPETVALVSLLHDVCKIDSYKQYMRNVKGDDGVWRQVPSYANDDKLPYGHGEKSVYIVSGFMRLSREEAFAIRYHMGFSGLEDKRLIGNALEMFPLAFALSTADMEATYYMEGAE